MDSLTERKKDALAMNVFAGGGEMGELMRSHDWSQTPLGPVENWSPSLRISVSTILASRFGSVLFWGHDYIELYNDATVFIHAVKHPKALGQPARENWAEIWDVMGPMFDQVMTTGEVFFDEDRLWPLFRFGNLEESYFTFCYSPVRDETGTIVAVLSTVTETTKQVISQRRLMMLRELATAGTGAKTLRSACLAAADTLNPYDVPFALIYQVNLQGNSAELVASTGLPPESAAAPPTINLTEHLSGWSLVDVLQSREPLLITDVVDRFGSLSVEPWGESPHSAFILPILSGNKEQVECLLVAGISPRLEFNAEYRSFLELVAQQVESSIATAQSYEQERQRAEALAELDRAKTAFFSNVSHEFRTPLTLMLNPLEQVIAQTHTVLQPEQREPVKLTFLLKEVINTILPDAKAKNIHIVELSDATSAQRDISVLGDDKRLQQIITKLLDNAIKFTSKGGRIEVRLDAVDPSASPGGGAAQTLGVNAERSRSIDSWATIQVKDTGIGISADFLPHVFERFTQAEVPSRHLPGGLGLGMAIARQLVELHGGTIEAVSGGEGGGATFTVKLPLV